MPYNSFNTHCIHLIFTNVLCTSCLCQINHWFMLKIMSVPNGLLKPSVGRFCEIWLNRKEADPCSAYKADTKFWRALPPLITSGWTAEDASCFLPFNHNINVLSTIQPSILASQYAKGKQNIQAAGRCINALGQRGIRGTGRWGSMAWGMTSRGA